MRFMAIHLPASFPLVGRIHHLLFWRIFFRSNLDAFCPLRPRARAEGEGRFFFLLLNRDKMMADH